MKTLTSSAATATTNSSNNDDATVTVFQLYDGLIPELLERGRASKSMLSLGSNLIIGQSRACSNPVI